MRRWSIISVVAVALCSATGCLFDGEETRGWPCDSDRQCGLGQSCEQGYCGGPEVAVDGSTGGDEEVDGDPPPTADGNDGTSAPGCTIEPTCEGSSSIRGCDGDQEVVLGCDELCDTSALGCAGSSSLGNDVCYCGPDFGTCSTVGQRSCNGGALNECGSDGIWDAYDCDALCAADGFQYAECGSDPASGQPICLCYDGGCAEGAFYCSGSSGGQLCNGGFYGYYSCDQLCATEALGCSSSPEGDACFCAT